MTSNPYYCEVSLKNHKSGRCLAVGGANNGTDVQGQQLIIWDCHTTASPIDDQVWWLQHTNPSHRAITSRPAAGRSLNLPTGRTAPGATGPAGGLDNLPCGGHGSTMLAVPCPTVSARDVRAGHGCIDVPDVPP